MAVSENNLMVGGAAVTISTDRGALKDGITVTPTVETLTLDLDQQTIPSKAWRMAEKYTVEFTMCEPTLTNIKHGWDSDNATSGGGPTTLSIGDHQFVPQNAAIIVAGKRPGATDGIRSLTFLWCVLETPAPIVFSKRQETNVKVGFIGLYTAAGYMAQFSDAA